MANSKPQPKGAGDSENNGANEKPDHPLNSAVVHSDGNGLGPSLDAAGVNPQNVHAPTAPGDSAVVIADVRVPAEPRAASADAKSDASSSALLPPGQPLPATTAADQPIISGAQLMDHPGQTEIRIEMQAGSLGVVELRAHVSGDQIGACIAVEHHDAQLLLTTDLPALHTALAEKNLRVNTLSISQGMAASTGEGQNGNASQKGFSPSHPKAAYVTREDISTPAQQAQEESPDAGRPGMRLSILA